MTRTLVPTLALLAILNGCSSEEPGVDPNLRDSVQSTGASATSETPNSAKLEFDDVTSAWNIDFVHDSGGSPEKHLPETMGGGVATFDLEGDGDLDLYFVQSGPVPTSRTGSLDSKRTANRLYRNESAGQFADVTDQSGAAAHQGCGMGVATGDVNGDGDTDLFVTNFGADVLLDNQGDGSFLNATESAGIFDDRWTSGCIFFDADNDGDLDLFVTGYVDIDVENPSWCGRREPGWRSYCHPDHYEGLADRYWRNRGDGSFEDATLQAGFSGLTGKGLAVASFDFDADGLLDLYVANDSVENHLWRNRGEGRFEDATLLSGTGVNSIGATEAGMGLATGDIDGDLDLDLLVTNFDHESNTVYLNLGDGLFRDGTLMSGLEAPSRMPVGFGCLLDDLDNDGNLDLVVANGHIIDNIEMIDDAQTWKQRSQIFLGTGTGKFAELLEGASVLQNRAMVARGLVSGDLDGDGDLELIFSECGGPPLVLQNKLVGGTAVEIHGFVTGTRVVFELDSGRKILRGAGPAPSYFSASHASIHLGLGSLKVLGMQIFEPGQPTRRIELNEPLVRGSWHASKED